MILLFIWNHFFTHHPAVLHLGNVFFHRKALKHGQEGVEMGSDAEVRWVSHLLQLRTDGIVAALTTKTTVRCLSI
jgi:myosin-15